MWFQIKTMDNDYVKAYLGAENNSFWMKWKQAICLFQVLDLVEQL